jgi:hypothetical protein
MSDGVYAFMDGDGNFFHTITTEQTPEYPNGKPQIYLAQLTADVIHQAATKSLDEGFGSAATVDPVLGGFRPPARTGGSGSPYFRSDMGPGDQPVGVTGSAAGSFGRTVEMNVWRPAIEPAPPGIPPTPTNVPRSVEVPPPEPPSGAAVPRGNVDTPPLSPLIEKEIQSTADQYIEVLKRNTNQSKEYLDEARKNFVDQQRGYYILNGVQ